MIRGVLCDLSGVVYLGNGLVPGAREALISLRAAGLPLKFVSNVTRMSQGALLTHLGRLGLDLAPEDLFTPALAVRRYLESRGHSAHLLVHPNLLADLGSLAGPSPDAVVVADAGHSFSYDSLNNAFRVLLEGASLLALGNNRYFREDDGLSLDVGPFVKALEYAAGQEALVLGKPAAEFFLDAVAALGLEPDDVVMVGDDVEADVGGALAAGLQAILVRTGKYRSGDEDRIAGSGALTCEDVGAATDLIL